MEFFKEIVAQLSPEGEASTSLLVLTLAATRILVILRMLPPLGGRIVPPSARIVLAIVLAWTMALPTHVGAMPAAPLVAVLILKEAAVGFVIGLLGSLPFLFLQQSGFLMDAARGGAMSQLLSPTEDESTTPLSNLFYFLSILLFFASPAGASFWIALSVSFTALPPLPGGFFPPQRMLEASVATSATLLVASVMVAFPVLLLALLVDLLAGLLGRFSPYGGGYFAFLPLKSVVGIGGAALSVVVFSPSIERMMAAAVAAIHALLVP
jgi:flagellar biosynthetic protein FliR